MNAARDMVRAWHPDATPEQIELLAAAIFRALSKLCNAQQKVQK